MAQKKLNRDFPLAPTPEISLYGSGGGGNYNINASANMPIFKGLSVGVNKSFNKNGEDANSNTSYSASLKIPLNKKKK